MNTYFVESEGLTDVCELLDDVDRWAHVADGHGADMYVRPLRDWELTPDYSARRYSAEERESRFMDLSWYLEGKRVAMLRARRGGRKYVVKKLRREIEYCVNGIQTRYRDSVQLILARQKNEWWLLYLTRSQKEDLLTLARDAWVGR